MKNWIVLSLALAAVSCSAQWGKGIKGNGNVVSIERSVGDYDAIAVSGSFDVDLVEGNEGELVISGEQNLLDYIVTEVQGEKLVIRVKKGINIRPSLHKGSIKVKVPVERIDALSLSGSGDIVGHTTLKTSRFKTSMSGSGDITLDVTTDALVASMSGSGDMNLSGNTHDFEATISGSGDIRAYDLNADNVEATISGSADIKVTVNEKLKARVSGSGDISYRGNPKKIDTKTSGSGDVSKG
ncbi:head GIN domain-containing protein [Zobellia sp. 1_MG-2023]|uniref:head GIN domain-containing protein n=1 Tax=Zobellia sp. 1_MG-2023 TaxID=3062626 RepID=UPI0026E4935E|nr:head GIN domain-containing protein [Zobellia sp. 1_MG-2023]MDO6820462.1 head GIN domain-containing protein [Zobellia sp. 1_MG-2023]